MVSTGIVIYCYKKNYCSGVNGSCDSFVPEYFFLESTGHVLSKMVRLITQLQVVAAPEFFEVLIQTSFLRMRIGKIIELL